MCCCLFTHRICLWWTIEYYAINGASDFKILRCFCMNPTELFAYLSADTTVRVYSQTWICLSAAIHPTTTERTRLRYNRFMEPSECHIVRSGECRILCSIVNDFAAIVLRTVTVTRISLLEYFWWVVKEKKSTTIDEHLIGNRAIS